MYGQSVEELNRRAFGGEPYTVYNPHSVSLTNRIWTSHEYIDFFSVDPGPRKMAFRVERRYLDGRILPRFFEKFSCEPIEGSKSIMILHKKKGQLSIDYDILFGKLESISHLILDVHCCIVESQFKPYNLKLESMIIGWLNAKLKDRPNLPIIISIDSKQKGRMLGIPSGIPRRELKKLTCKKIIELFLYRQDYTSLYIMLNDGDKFDLADSSAQIEAYCIMEKLPIVTRKLIDITQQYEYTIRAYESSSKSLMRILLNELKTNYRLTFV